MAEITDSKANIYEEEVRYRSAISESTFFKMGGSVNFINNRMHMEKKWCLNGRYDQIAIPTYAIDGITIFNYDVEIFGCYMYCAIVGTGGTTTLDVMKMVSSGVSGGSIFSTPPSISYTAGNISYIGVGGSGTGMTAPVISGGVYQLNAGQGLACNITNKQSGAVRDCGLVLYYRPR